VASSLFAVADLMIKTDCRECKRSYTKNEILFCSHFSANAELEGIDKPTNIKGILFMLNKEAREVLKIWKGNCAGFRAGGHLGRK
jgi:hypothetical protein